jgi:hypothetical protein
LIAALSNASSVTITDHPSSPALTAGGIEQNVKANLFSKDIPRTTTLVSIHGYTWGSALFYSTSRYGSPIPPPHPASLPPSTQFTTKGYPRPSKIIIADCLWMPSQHEAIIQTIHDFLPIHESSVSPPPANGNTATAAAANGANPNTPAALVVAGFHTGRAIVRDFFALATGHPSSNCSSKSSNDTSPDPSHPEGQPQASSSPPTTSQAASSPPKLKLAQIYETDMSGNRRPWTWDATREGEGKWEAKRWCVVGVLVRAPEEAEEEDEKKVRQKRWETDCFSLLVG